MWYHVPSKVLPSALDSADSNLGSTQPSSDIELYVTSSGTVTPRALSWRAWKNRPWMRLLYGTMLKPSILGRGAAKWASYLPVSPASPSATPGNNKAPRMNGGSGPKLSESFAWWDPDSCSWRTWQRSLMTGEPVEFSGTWPKWGMMRNGECSPQDEPALRTSESEYSFWPTATSRDATGSGSHGYSSGHAGVTLTDATARGVLWPTPNAADGYRGSDEMMRGNPTLQGQARWSTPHKNSHAGAGNEGRDGGENIQTQATNWATPTARDHKDGTAEGEAPTNPLLGRQAPRTQQHGDKSSNKSRHLNPRFVEWLMGLPTGWSNPLSKAEQIDSEDSGTPLSQFKQRWRSYILREGLA